MEKQGTLELRLRVGRKTAVLAVLILALGAAFLLWPDGAAAQKAQENYKDKFNIATDTSGVSITSSADGKYVYVAGPVGILVSDDFGKTGTWVQTVRLK